MPSAIFLVRSEGRARAKKETRLQHPVRPPPNEFCLWKYASLRLEVGGPARGHPIDSRTCSVRTNETLSCLSRFVGVGILGHNRGGARRRDFIFGEFSQSEQFGRNLWVSFCFFYKREPELVVRPGPRLLGPPILDESPKRLGPDANLEPRERPSSG